MVMRKSLGEVEGFVGVDVSQRWLDVHLLPSGERAGFSRDRRGIARLIAWLASKGRLLVVVRATGGLERGLRAALRRTGAGSQMPRNSRLSRIGQRPSFTAHW
jgi:hypothetical protein